MAPSEKLALYAIAFFSGFVLMGYEILGGRAIAPYYGSSIYVWGALISVTLAGLSVGYAVGGRLADRGADHKTLSRVLFVPAALIAAFPLYGYACCRCLYALELNSRLGSLALSAALFLVPCAFIGAVTPILMRTLAVATGKTGSAAGNVYAISTLGNIAGTLFTSFFLVSWIGVSTGVALLGLLLGGCWALALIFFRRAND